MAKRVTKGNLWGFIQSRPYASVADIRRLFSIYVDDASPVLTSEGACYIGLPQDAAEIVRQLWAEGRIILDLNPDVKARVVQGVYPTRVPMNRQAPAHGIGEQDAAASGPTAGPASGTGASSAKRKRRRRRGRTDNGTPPTTAENDVWENNSG